MHRSILLALPALLLAACDGNEATQPSPTASSVASVATGLPTTPAEQQPTTTAYDAFYSIDFISPDVGWAAGAKGIFGTKDGGAHWLQQYRGVGDAPTGQVDFIDASMGFASSYRGLMSTRDGGEHWIELSPDGENLPEHVDFVNSLTGWAIAATQRGDPTKSLLRTGDGGESYSVARSPADSVCFGDERDGWYAVDGSVMHTMGAGATWVATLERPLPNWGENHPWQDTIHCAGRDVAWVQFIGGIAAGSQAYAVFRTVDGGAHWDPVMQAPIGPALGTHVGSGNSPGPVAVLDAANAWVMGVCGPCDAVDGVGTSSIEATHDGGLTWDSPVTIPGAGAFPYDLQFVDEQHGWLATSNGILATSDGGRTWATQR